MIGKHPALFVLSALLVALPLPGRAQTPEVDSVAGDGRGASHWGPIPPPADSVTVRSRPRSVPLWEQVLVAPYVIGKLPFQALARGTEELVRLGTGSELVHEVVEFFVEPRRVRIIPRVETGGLSGTGGGVSLRVDPFLWAGSRARGRASATHPGDLRLHAGVLGPVGSGGQVELGLGFRRRENARFFGLGPGSGPGSASIFQSEEAWVGGGFSRALGRDDLALEVDLVLSRVGAFPSDEDDGPPLLRVFDEIPVGFGRFSDGLTAGVALIHQTVRETGRPSSGGIRQLQVAFLRSLDGEFSDYWAFRAEAQQFVHLANEHQVLALRGFATWIDPTGAGVVPFQRLMTNDAPDLLRGHQDFRFRDRGMAVLSAEYRWPLWVWSRAHGTGLDMYLLSDVGQVFRRRKDLATSSLSTSVGAGLRLVGDRDFVGLLEVGRSDEEWVVRLRGEQIFQFARGGLYYGQSRVPNR